MFSNRNKPTDPADQPRDEAPDETGAQSHDVLQAQIDALTAERDEAKAAYMRALADFQNFQRRSIENEREAKRQGVTSLLLSVVPVIDHFDMALALDPEKSSAKQVLDGVQAIRDDLLRVLGMHGVSPINPQPNDELDPNRHHALMQQAAPGVEPGRISRTLQVGYALGDRVIRPANVMVAPNA
jgi:molecular chaperone GrpE